MFFLSMLMLVFAFPSQEAAGQAPKVLKLESGNPSGARAYENMVLFAERVEKLSGGTLKFDCVPAGAVVPALEIMDAVSKGVLDAGHTAPAWWSGKNKACALYAAAPGGPFGLDLWDYHGWLFYGGGMELWRELYQDVLKRNVVPFHTTIIAPQIFGWFKNPIKSLADVKGRKCRMGGLTGDVYVGIGMKSVMLPVGEIIPAAERGIVECGELIGFADDMKLGFQQVWKYVYSPGVHEPNCILELLINGDVWKKLTPQHQEIIKAAATEMSFHSHCTAIKANALALKELEEKHGVHAETTPPEILTKVLEVWDKMVKEESAKNPIFKKIIDSQRAYAQMVVPAHRQYIPDYSFVANHYFPVKGKKK
jgi:TRAP-type mannitol/chloroaromatic compound transport system substrate-binding protein